MFESKYYCIMREKPTLKKKTSNYRFCPFCGRLLETIKEEGRLMSHCYSCNWTYYPHVASSAAAIIVRKNKVLLVRRARDPYVNTWMFPAGFVSYGEHPTETLAREVYEETRLKVRHATLMEVLQCDDDPRSPGDFQFFYKTAVCGTVKNLDDRENSGIGWFDIVNPPKIGWKAHRIMMKRLQAANRKRAQSAVLKKTK
jgi:ADP-ribose pyrophosphatase YjhB (NUDIX family)